MQRILRASPGLPYRRLKTPVFRPTSDVGMLARERAARWQRSRITVHSVDVRRQVRLGARRLRRRFTRRHWLATVVPRASHTRSRLHWRGSVHAALQRAIGVLAASLLLLSATGALAHPSEPASVPRIDAPAPQRSRDGEGSTLAPPGAPGRDTRAADAQPRSGSQGSAAPAPPARTESGPAASTGPSPSGQLPAAQASELEGHAPQAGAAANPSASVAARGPLASQPDPSAASAARRATATPSADVAAARALVARAELLFERRHYDAALAEFMRAYRALGSDPRAAPLLYNVALCHERMFHYELALQFYQRYLAEAGPDAPDRAQVRALLAALPSLLARLHIASNTPAEVWIDGRHASDAPGQVLITAGHHVLELRARLHEPARRELDAGAGTVLQLSFELARLSDARGPRPLLFWVSAGLSGAALATGAVLGVRALDEDRAGKRRERVSPYANSAQDRQRVKHLALGADIAFASAALLGAAASLLFFVSDWEPAEAPRPAQARVTPSFAANSAGLNLRGVFP